MARNRRTRSRTRSTTGRKYLCLKDVLLDLVQTQGLHVVMGALGEATESAFEGAMPGELEATVASGLPILLERAGIGPDTAVAFMAIIALAIDGGDGEAAVSRFAEKVDYFVTNNAPDVPNH